MTSKTLHRPEHGEFVNFDPLWLGMTELQERSKRAGRDPRSLSISISAAGDPEESKLYRYRELGVERVVLGVGREDVDVKEKVLPFLDRYAKFIPKLV